MDIRNVAIIAHIDHGKTTLLDRIIQICNPSKQKTLLKKERLADVMELEQERGITIKMQPVTISWSNYTINIVDTPGHIDFNYEVSRALSAVEGAILLIDVTQGIQAQTIENLLLALEHNLAIIPVLNKIDIANPELIQQRITEIEESLGFVNKNILLTSGKTGEGVTDLLNTIITKIPPPTHNRFIQETNSLPSPLALIIDAQYDNYDGVILTTRILTGTINKNQQLYIPNTHTHFTVRDVGIYTPQRVPSDSLIEHSIGYIKTGIKNPSAVYTGATITTNEINYILPGYNPPKPKLYSSFYPDAPTTYEELKDAIYKLKLNDFSLYIEDDRSLLLGKGFRLGFLGMLHLDIVKTRLEREFNTKTIATYPTVPYRIQLKDGTILTLKTPAQYPTDIQTIEEIAEPFINTEIITPSQYLSPILDLLKNIRGELKDIQDINLKLQNETYHKIIALVPYSEIIENFFNKLKSISHGFASVSYGEIIYKSSQSVKVDILINHDPRPELSFITHPTRAEAKARQILAILKKTIPPTIIPIPLQASIKGRIIARETIRAQRKNVTAKLYGGDVRRKMKLLRNQAKLKKYRAQFVKVKIPADFFKQVLRTTNQ